MKHEIKIKPAKGSGSAEKPMKRLAMNILFRNSGDLADLFTEVRREVQMGAENYTRETTKGIIDLRVEYSTNHQYEERIINGDVCYIYKSKA